MGFTEPSFGTNLFEMKTSGVKDDGVWIINGVKRWNSSNWAQVVNVFALCKDKKTRERGICGFTLLKSMPGIISGPEALTCGVRSVMQNALILQNVRVGLDYLLGEPYKGFAMIEPFLIEARLAFCFGLIGAMKRVLQIVMRFLSKRKGLTGKLVAHAYIIDKLDHMCCSLYAIESLALHCTTLSSAGYPISHVISMLLKIAASEYAIKNVQTCMQLAGGRGYMENNHIARYMKDVLASYYGEGANDSLLSLAGKEILDKSEFSTFIESICKTNDYIVEFKKTAETSRSTLSAHAHPKQYLEYIYPHFAKLSLSLLLYCATLKKAASESCDGHRANAWAKLNYLKKLRDFNEEHLLKKSFLPDAGIQASIQQFVEDIGDVEFQMLGEETTRDAYLK